MRRESKSLVIACVLASLLAADAKASAGSAGQRQQADADFILLEKGKRRLTLWSGGTVVREYQARIGKNPVGDKVARGDKRTPEGIYRISGRNSQSRFHLSLRVDYPRAEDVREARRRGVDPGGDIFLHGLPNKYDRDVAEEMHDLIDWTDGCVAVTNDEIREIWSLVPDGTPIVMIP